MLLDAMINEYPNLPDSGRYSIGEAASILGINRHTLRKHSDEGFIKYGIRKTNMRKFYTGSEINRYWKAMF